MEPNQNMNIPLNYKPISAWGYIGYNFLFAIPLVGLILMIVFACSNENINRRNYARSYLILMLLVIALAIVFTSIGVLLMGTM